MIYPSRLNIKSRRQRQTAAQRIVRLARGLGDIAAIENRVSVYVGVASTSEPGVGTSGAAPTSSAPPDPDPYDFLADLAAVDQLLDRIYADLTVYDQIRERWMHPPTTEDFDLTDEVRPPDACEWHWTILRTYEPVKSRNPTTVGSILLQPAAICSPCYERVRQLGRPPRRDDLEYHRDNGRWKRHIRDQSSRRRSS